MEKTVCFNCKNPLSKREEREYIEAVAEADAWGENPPLPICDYCADEGASAREAYAEATEWGHECPPM